MSDQEDLAKVVERVQKLLALAARNPNEAEAASATSKAHELLAAYNLDMIAVERAQGGSAKREAAALKGGAYAFQRQLWRDIAELNMCLYFPYKVRKPAREVQKREGYTKVVRGYTFEHRVVGRVANTTATRVMAQYLEQVIERLVRERLGGDHRQLFSRWAMSFREGVCAEIRAKVQDRYVKFLDEQKRKRQEEEERLRAAGAGSSSTALVLSEVIDAEKDSNIDFLHGEGYSARQRAARAQRAAAQKAAEEEYTRWAEANPEEARKKEEERRKEREKYWAKRRGGRRGYGGGSDKTDWGAYEAGREAGKNVSIDQQADHAKAKGAIGHG